MIYEPIPLKRCTKCGEWLPNTTEYFRRREKKTGSWCRQCCRAVGARYRQANPDKKKESNWRWRNQDIERSRQRESAYRENNREQKREIAKRYREAHPDTVHKQQKRWAETYPDRKKEAAKRYRKEHPEQLRVKGIRRKARQCALPATFTVTDWQVAIEYFGGVCAYCGNPPRLWDNPRVLHQEHHTPVFKGGGYTSDNIVPACQSCNLSKGFRDPVEWLNERFGERKAKQILKRIQAYFVHVLDLNP